MDDHPESLTASALIDELFHVLRDVATASQGVHHILYSSFLKGSLSVDQERLFVLLKSYDTKLASYAAFVDQWRRSQGD